MKSDTILRYEGMDILIKHLGKVNAEKFIALMIKEPFDYTKWQNDLWTNKTVREISREAMEYHNSSQQ
ncbi:MAG: hypothetical protein K6U80_11555 [Firmicutes bacterium]|nr:hypothetical protein [Bacillota bacterium]